MAFQFSHPQSQKRRPPAHQHLCGLDHPPDIWRIFSIPGCFFLWDRDYTHRLYSTSVHGDGAERGEDEGRVSGRVRVKKKKFKLKEPNEIEFILLERVLEHLKNDSKEK